MNSLEISGCALERANLAVKTTVFCAVWHKDPRREELLRAHVANLARQSVETRRIYVFDGGDRPPSWLTDDAICITRPLTIYQAWNLALAAVDTPLVMNLNLDDRLSPDAIGTLENSLIKERAALVGGDWRICFSQEETDRVQVCEPATNLPFESEWPPTKPTRLGSGTGDRGTYGPATLWHIQVHRHLPRYPWRLSDGTLIQAVSDTLFWTALNQLGAKTVRLPMIIGNYHSHPGDQAEFRWADELKRIAQKDIEPI